MVPKIANPLISATLILASLTALAAEPALPPQVLAAQGADTALVAQPSGDLLWYDRSQDRLLRASRIESGLNFLISTLSRENAGIPVFATYDETGRLFRTLISDDHIPPVPLGADEWLVGLTPQGRISHIASGAGGYLAPEFDAQNRLSRVTTHWGTIAFDPDGRARQGWTHGGTPLYFSYREDALIPRVTFAKPIRPGARLPALARNWDPHHFISMSQTDRFVRHAWDLIARNKALSNAHLQIGRDYEAYWTQGRYLSDDPYYRTLLSTLPPPRSMAYHASGELAADYTINRAAITAILYGELAKVTLQVALFKERFLYLAAVVGTNAFQEVMNAQITSSHKDTFLDLVRSLEFAVDKAILVVDLAQLFRPSTFNRWFRYAHTGYLRTPFFIRDPSRDIFVLFGRSVYHIPYERPLWRQALFLGPRQRDVPAIARAFATELGAELGGEAIEYVASEAIELAFRFDRYEFKNPLFESIGFVADLKPDADFFIAPELKDALQALPDPGAGGVLIENRMTTRKGNLKRLRNRFKGCHFQNSSSCEGTEP